jgi:hypothetical protein
MTCAGVSRDQTWLNNHCRNLSSTVMLNASIPALRVAATHGSFRSTTRSMSRLRRALVVLPCVWAGTVAIASDPTVNYDPVAKAVSNWQGQAAINLGASSEQLAKSKTLRCIKLNNYWCLKDIGWQGGIGRDCDGHTAFADGSFAARAAVRNLRTAYVTKNRRTALQLISAYAPADDCVGSNAAKRSDGTCIYGKNPTVEYAKMVAKGIADDPNADLHLFDINGKATDSLTRVLQNLSSFEIGFSATTNTIKRGICLEDESCQ